MNFPYYAAKLYTLNSIDLLRRCDNVRRVIVV